MAWLLSPTGIMAAIIAALSISNVVFVKLYGSKSDDYANYRAIVAAAQKQAAADAELRQQQAERIARQTADGSYADETLSARAHRNRWWIEPAINCLFFDRNHCRDSYINEQNRAHLPPEYWLQRYNLTKAGNE